MKPLALLIGSTLCSLTVAHAAYGGTFHREWNYSIDALTDGAGGDGYEIKGLATKETKDHIYVSVSGSSPLTGVDSPNAEDGNVGWGDILFNFSGDDINTANGSLFGIRFADSNDSGVAQVGVFGNVTAVSVAQSNAGYDHLQQYYQTGWERPNTMGDLATVQEAYDYMGETDSMLTSIADGTFLGVLALLSEQDALAAGVDFEHFNIVDSDIHTVRFNRGLLPGGEFIATLLMECANDGVALLGRFTAQNQDPQDVPEPTSMIGLMVIGLVVSRGLGRTLESRTKIHRSNQRDPDEFL